MAKKLKIGLLNYTRKNRGLTRLKQCKIDPTTLEAIEKKTHFEEQGEQKDLQFQVEFSQTLETKAQNTLQTLQATGS